MAFVDALYDGSAELDGILAKRANTLRDLPFMLRCRRAVPVVDTPLGEIIAAVHPEVLVDARMRKHQHPEAQRGLAPLTIGLGPNFVAGGNVDVAVETAWGDDLGAVIREGSTRALAGEPTAIEGHSRDRYVYAPVTGVFATTFQIGDGVMQDQEVARIDHTAVHAPISGSLRGISRDGALVVQGTKVIEVDPRGDAKLAHGLGERAKRIAEGVLEAIRQIEA